MHSDFNLPKDRPAWFNHVLYNPSGQRVMFFCRIQKQDGKGFLTSLWTINRDGSDLKRQIPYRTERKDLAGQISSRREIQRVDQV
jgi:hypothetical protein